MEELDEQVEELDEHELHHKLKLTIGVSIQPLRQPGISIGGRDDHPFHRWDVVGRKFSTRWVTIVINGVRGPIKWRLKKMGSWGYNHRSATYSGSLGAFCKFS